MIRKLLWFREGGEVSTNQWRDIVEILRVSGAGLDDSYLGHWTAALGLSGLFERARREAGR